MAIIAYWDAPDNFLPDPGVVNNGVGFTPETYMFGDVLLARIPDSATAATFMNFPVTLSPSEDFFARFYFSTPNQWGPTATNVLSFRPNPSTMAFSIAFSGAGQPGQIRVVGTGGTILANSSNNTLGTSGQFFIEIAYHDPFSTGTRSLSVLVADADTDETLWEIHDLDVSSVFSSNITRVDWGKTTATDSGSFFAWAFALVDDSFIGRHPDDPYLSTAPPTGPQFGLYTGGELYPAIVDVLSGGNIRSDAFFYMETSGE